MIYFVGAGPGAPDLITVRGAELLSRAGMIVYTGSLINPELLRRAAAGCEVYDSASMTLDEVMDTLLEGERRGLLTVRLHTGDPSLYGALREQMDRLRAVGISFEVVPGVSSLCAAAAAIPAEYTLPGVSQTVIISRLEGRTPVPERESLRSLAAHQASMVLFLSGARVDQLCAELTAGGYSPGTPAAAVYRASWPKTESAAGEQVIRGTLATLPQQVRESGLTRTLLVLVGKFLDAGCYEPSRLYSAGFSHGFREARP